MTDNDKDKWESTMFKPKMTETPTAGTELGHFPARGRR